MDYAVEANIQVVQFTGNYSGFGINMREIQSSSNEQAYSAYIDPTSAGGAGISVVGGDLLKNASFNPGTNFHGYPPEVRGNTITFFIDGAGILTAVENKSNSTGAVVLCASNN